MIRPLDEGIHVKDTNRDEIKASGSTIKTSILTQLIRKKRSKARENNELNCSITNMA